MADLLLRRLTRSFPDVTAKAYAGDLAIVSHDIVKDGKRLMDLFSGYGDISGLRLNLGKTVVVPLWRQGLSEIRSRMAQEDPLWACVKYGDRAEYLGFVLGPGKGEHSWDKPLKKTYG